MVDLKQDEQQPTYRRSHQSSDTRASHSTEDIESEKVRLTIGRRYKMILLILSAILAIISVANPLLTTFINDYQSVALYTGKSLLMGTVPFKDTFATGGILYYLLIALSYQLGSSAWLMILQFLTYYMAGSFFFKIIAYTTGNTRLASHFTVIFYLLNLGLGFGGLYPIQFAMAFIMPCLWFVTKYFSSSTKDENFITYGFFATVAALIDPKTLILWVIILLMIGAYNLVSGHLARGFYQILCMIFGALVVYYIVGYFIFEMGNLKDYIDQALIYNFSNFALETYSIVTTLPFILLVAAASGLLLGLYGFFTSKSGFGEFKALKWILVATILFTFVGVLFSRTFAFFPLLEILPYALILTGIEFHEQAKRELEDTSSHRIKRRYDFEGNLTLTFVRKHFYLPLVVVVAGILIPIYHSISNAGMNQERLAIANYIKGQTDSDAKIYVWDNTTAIYLESDRTAMSRFPLPVVYTAAKANASVLQDDLLADSAEIIVVNQADELPAGIEQNIESSYEKANLEGAEHFTVYQKK